MNPLTVLCFSKDRPLQLQGFIESLLHYSGLQEQSIAIIYRVSRGYDTLLTQYPAINWIAEASAVTFDSALRTLVAGLSDDQVVLFGCDDVVYLRPFNPQTIVSTIAPNPDDGFTLRRHGPLPSGSSNGLRCGSIRYPFELMASAYSGKFIRQLVESYANLFKLPNVLEAYGAGYVQRGRLLSRMWAHDSPAFAVGQDVNRVQNLYHNRFRGTQEHEPQKLLALYESGYRLDWRALAGLELTETFVGDDYWKLVPPEGNPG